MLIVVIVLAAASAAHSVGSIVRVRVHIARLVRNERKSAISWRIVNMVSFVSLVAAIGVAVAAMLLPEFIPMISAVVTFIVVASIVRYHTTNGGLREVAYYQDRYQNYVASGQESQAVSDRYVQRDIGTILEKGSIEDVTEGDNIDLRSKILSVDLYNYIAAQSIADKKEEFRYLSRCTHEAGTILYAHGCIIAQVVGYGLTAVFSKDSLKVIEGVIAMNKRLEEMRYHESEGAVTPSNYTLIQGVVTLGVLSNGKTIQPVISSETIELVYPIQRLVRRLHIPMVIDEFSRRAHETLDKYAFRYIGLMENKASGHTIKTHEVLDLHASHRRGGFIESNVEFEQARHLQERGEMREAHRHYSNVVSTNPFDLLAKHFQEQCGRVISRLDTD